MPCTTILVGKKATYDGSTMMARNEDAGGDNFAAKKFVVVLPENQPRVYKAVLSKVEIPLPENPMRYTSMPNATGEKGIWGEAGFNTDNVAMSATETITSNGMVQGADPLVKDGIGEEDMITIVLPYIHSAREGVERMGSLLEKYGTYEMNGIAFQDVNEIWWLETIGGHHFIAKRVPDEAYVVGPNQLGIDYFDMTDAFGAQKDHMCSADLLDFIKDNHLDLGYHAEALEDVKDFDIRAAFGSHADSDHVYNTPRAWFMERYFNPNTFVWDGPDADFTPESDDIFWSLVPEKKITVEDIKYVLSSYYQGTEFNPYEKHRNSEKRGMYRPIGINRNNFVAITQIRPYMPEEIRAVEWIAVGSNAFNAAYPFYGNVNDTPSYLRDTTALVTTESFYWTNRIVAALADAHFGATAIFIERYQNSAQAKGHEFVKEFDKKYLEEKPEDVSGYLEECNQTIADFARKETYDLLDNVLLASSREMKNRFARSDA